MIWQVRVLYRDALVVPNPADALHMLGVSSHGTLVMTRRRRAPDLTALDGTNSSDWRHAAPTSAALSRMLTAQSLWRIPAPTTLSRRTPSNPVSGHQRATVSVIAARLQPRTLSATPSRSVLAQNIPPLELIVI